MERRFTILASTLILLFFFGSCTKKASKLYEKGNYEQALNKALTKYKKGKKTDVNDIKLLERAYEKAVQQDLTQLEKWEQTDNDQKWERIFDRIDNIELRQERLIPYLPIQANNGYEANIEILDMASKKREVGLKAAQINYDYGLNALNSFEDTGDKDDAREAYDYFWKTERFSEDFEDARDLMYEAERLGTTYVLIDLDNSTTSYLPYQFRNDLERSIYISDDRWIKYDREIINGIDYDYRINVSFRDIDIEPERENRNQQEYTKTLTEYKRDSDGNYVLDSNGERIEEETVVKARAITTIRTKEVRLDMEYRLVSERTFREIDRRRFTGQDSFRDESCRIQGDERALPSGYNCSGDNPRAFPQDEEMLERAFADFRNELRRQIDNDRYID